MKRAAVAIAVTVAVEILSVSDAWPKGGEDKDPVTTYQPGKGQEGRFGVGKGHFRPTGTGTKRKGGGGKKPASPYKVVIERNYRGPETAHCPDGLGWRRWRVRRSDNQRVNVINSGCGSGPEAAGASKEEVIPVPVLGISPRAEGLTGLATGLWYEGPTERSASINVAGEAMTVVFKPALFTWTMGDGTTITRTEPGSSAQWAAEHTYERRGDYAIELEVRWDGSYTRTPPGGAPETVAVTPIIVTGTLAYHVIEVRAGLDG